MNIIKGFLYTVGVFESYTSHIAVKYGLIKISFLLDSII